VTQLTSAISLAVSAGSSTLSASELSAVQKQVSDIRDNVVSLANTSYQGSYIFSGSAGSVQPYRLDSSTTPATAVYSGDSVTRTASTPEGQAVPLNVPGNAIFSASGADVLGTLNQLVADLGSGNTSAIASDSSSLTTALGNVSQQRSVIDTSLSRLGTATTYASTQEAELKAEQSTLLSADPAQVATDLSTAETQHQAILGVISSIGQKTLFDYLQ
jgi:flagellar hook-associated protein 3 FlgL